jgi:hypothetical protein
MSYIPQHEVRAELTRILGFGNWDTQVHDVRMLFEDSEQRGDKTYWVVGYSAACTLRIRDFKGRPVSEYTEYHAESNAPQPNRGEAHALCLTSVESYAFRRAAIALGDGLGLGLYRGGDLSPLVRGTLQMEEVFGVTPATPSAEKQAALAHSLGMAENASEEPTGEATAPPETTDEEKASA